MLCLDENVHVYLCVLLQADNVLLYVSGLKSVILHLSHTLRFKEKFISYIYNNLKISFELPIAIDDYNYLFICRSLPAFILISFEIHYKDTF